MSRPSSLPPVNSHRACGAGLSGNQALDHVHDVLGKNLDSIPLSRIWRLLHVPSFIPPSRK